MSDAKDKIKLLQISEGSQSKEFTNIHCTVKKSYKIWQGFYSFHRIWFKHACKSCKNLGPHNPISLGGGEKIKKKL